MAEIEALRQLTYSTNLEMLLQQKGSKFANLCRVDTVSGTKAHRMLSQIDSVEVSERTTRAEVIDNTTVNYDGRWVYWKRQHFGTIVDDLDTLQTGIDPNGMILQSAVSSLARQADDDFLNAFFGTAMTGETGGTSTTFTAGNQVAVTEGVGSATGLNIKKLRAAMKILLQNEVDLDTDQVYIGVSPRQNDELLNFTEVISSDFNKPILGQDGRIRSFLGFNFIVSNRLPTDSNSYRRLPVWVPRGMGCANWINLRTDIRELPNYKSKPIYIEAETQKGFTRLEENFCVEIKCSEA